MTRRINTRYRPKSHFGPRSLEKYTLGKVKGAIAREMLTEHPELDGTEILERMVSGEISPQALASLGNVHPMFLGGNFLPDATNGEIEIARIEIASTTGDVTALLARPERGKIHYRIVDEYEGETLNSPTSMVSDKPLSLGEMTDFFLSAWSLVQTLRMNFEDDLESALAFFTAKSDFYTEFDDLCRWQIANEYRAISAKDNPRVLSEEDIESIVADLELVNTVSWLGHQSEASLTSLKKQMPNPIEEQFIDSMDEIEAGAKELKLSQDFLSLCTHYNISPPKLKLLAKRLLKDANTEREKRWRKTAAMKNKLERKIDLMLS